MRCPRAIQGLASLLVSLALLWGSGPACMLASSLARERARCCCERAIERSGGTPIVCPHCAASQTPDAQRHPGFRTACSPGAPAAPAGYALGMFEIAPAGALPHHDVARALGAPRLDDAPRFAAALDTPPPRLAG